MRRLYPPPHLTINSSIPPERKSRMSLDELYRQRFRASSGNSASFDIASALIPGQPNARRVVIVTRWQFAPTVADIDEARRFIDQVKGFQHESTSSDRGAAMQYLARGQRGSPLNN
jgi:hypothetical protein